MRKLLLVLEVLALASPAVAGERRVAVVVGANAATSGRQPLRYAYDDARGVAAVLAEVGGFLPTDVDVLLDPLPSEVLASVDMKLAERPDVFLFYYSGHADGAAFYPHGEKLAMEVLRQRLDGTGSTVRIGVVDGCRGGAWTRAKGMTPAELFEVESPLLQSEGSVLMASSSGLEDAHESEQLHGSYFTHHLVAGLRGAADTGSDGEVSVSEAFEYAKALTVRDTALQTDEAQHPSFDINIRGRHDVPLAFLRQARSVVAIEQREGPLQVLRLDSGLLILELPSGERTTRLAVPPGSYLVRRKQSGATRARQIDVAAGTTVALREEELELVGTDLLAAKSADSGEESILTSLAHPAFELRGGILRRRSDTLEGESVLWGREDLAGQLGLAVEWQLGEGLSTLIDVSSLESGKMSYQTYPDYTGEPPFAYERTSLDWDAYALGLQFRFSELWFDGRFVTYGQLGGGPAYGRTHSRVSYVQETGLPVSSEEVTTSGPETTRSYWGYHLSAALGLRVAWSQHVGLFAQASYAYAPVVKSDSGERHNHGGPSIAAGIQLSL